ncbi:MAG: hypothetical protein K6G71_01745 [Clostridiales bacterium]|nr:hypothetical protein [Clostridiales bacterium]
MITDEVRREYVRLVDTERLAREYTEFHGDDPEVMLDVLTLAVARDRESGIPENEFSYDTWRLMTHAARRQIGMRGCNFIDSAARSVIRIWIADVHEKYEFQCEHCRRWSNERNLAARYFEDEGWLYVCPKCKSKYEGMFGIRGSRD